MTCAGLRIWFGLVAALAPVAATAQTAAPAESLAAIARMLRDEGRLQPALQTYNEAIALDSALAVAYGGRAYTWYLLQKPDSGWVDVVRARALGMTHPQLMLVAGMIQGARGNYAESERELNGYVAAVPAAWDGWYVRGLARMGLHHAAAARADFDRAAAVGMISPALDFQRGRVRAELGERDSACVYLRRAAEASSEDADDLRRRLCAAAAAPAE